jgi:hypothetical protein
MKEGSSGYHSKICCKWMARRVYLKLLSTTTFIQCCCRQVLARKQLQRLQLEAKELSIKAIGDLKMNHLEERGNGIIQARSDSEFGVTFLLSSFTLLRIT